MQSDSRTDCCQLSAIRADFHLHNVYMSPKRSMQADLRGRWKMSWIDPSLITQDEDVWKLLSQVNADDIVL